MVITLKLLTEEDLPFLIEVRNHESTRINLENNSVFTLKQCKKWFKTLKDPWYLIKDNNIKIGYIRINNEYIGVDIHIDHRKKGYAKLAWKEILSKITNAKLWVFDDNFAKQLYLDLGFIETENIKYIRKRKYIEMKYENL